ncbi:nuclear transport factor 2 family protein [Variovorax sp. EBFNA2]|uniref:nuclear transport factor 2 family protein n=1 Tax=Variovorax sp. EBFNA2 TaxID=3342097 RepID=UPI0029C000AA|nr:nuclear transport factor 2 family protein [Variovorax boronicumulans]WPG39717.1 nuclear transport factor 2 family protein [Variovorax boronicumulans]
MLIRKFFLAAAATAVFAGCAASGGGSNSASAEPAVAAAAERLRVAMVDPTPAALRALVADDLSYGHSGGKVDTQASFISDLLDRKSDFVSIAITDQTIKVVDGNTAIVRHTLTADTNDSGKPGKVALKILGIWQKQGGEWKLLARQAVRLTT